jgi:hypothetical protein
MHTVSVLLLLAGAVILAGVVVVAMGRGGEMAEFPSDYVPPRLGELLTASDVAVLRPPSALWGYNTQVTDEALSRIAQIVTERDVEIAVLRQQLADLRSAAAPHHVDAPHRSAGTAVAAPAPAEADATPGAAEADATPGAAEADATPGAAEAGAGPDTDGAGPAGTDPGREAPDEAPPVQAHSDEAATPGDE